MERVENIIKDFKERLIEEIGLDEIKRYYKEFKDDERTIDYNINEYGNLDIYYSDMEEYLNNFGFITDNIEDDEIENIYRMFLGIATTELIENSELIAITPNEIIYRKLGVD